MTKRSDAYLPFYVGDYLRDTGHLSTEQHGAYLLLLMACWTHGRLPDNDRQLAAIAKASQKKWEKLRQNVEGFFYLKGDGYWRQKRIDFERQRAENIRAVRSKSGSKGLANRWQNDSNGHSKTIAKNVTTESESSIEHKESLNRAPARESSAGFEKESKNFIPARSARLRPAAALKANKKELLRQKEYRYVDATMTGEQRSAAIAGLSGADPEHDEQWWLDAIDKKRRAEHWEDREGN